MIFGTSAAGESLYFREPGSRAAGFISAIRTKSALIQKKILGYGKRFRFALGFALFLIFAGAGAQPMAANVDAEALERFQRGIVLAEQKQTESALAVFEQLTRDYPGWPEPFNNLAVLYASRGEEKKAEAALLAALRTHPSYALIYRNLNDLYAGIAERAYRKALESEAGETDPPRLALATEVALPRDTTGSVSIASPAEGERAVPDTVAAVAARTETAVVNRPVSEPEPPPLQVAAALAEPLKEPLTRTREPAATQSPGQTGLENEVLDAVTSWLSAWSSQDVERYLSFYGHHFQPGGGVSRERWESLRRVRVSKPAFIEVRIAEPMVRLEAGDRAVVRFLQRYRSNTFEGRTWKTLHMSRGPSGWKIIREQTGS